MASSADLKSSDGRKRGGVGVKGEKLLQCTFHFRAIPIFIFVKGLIL